MKKSPFGMQMPGRGYNAGNYSYGFNGKQDDKDITNGGQDYGMRIYDKRLGRFLSVDPITNEYPAYTPYQFAGNKPTWAVDIDGLEDAKFDYAYSPQFIGGAGMGASDKKIYQDAFDKYVGIGTSALASELVVGEATAYLAATTLGKVASWGFGKLFGNFAKKIPSQVAGQTPKVIAKAEVKTIQEVATAEKVIVKTEESALKKGSIVKNAANELDGIVSTTLRVQKQVDEHIVGGARLGTNSYLNSVDDATTVLKAAHSGEAKILSTNVGQNRAYVQYNNVTGYYNNSGVIIPTNKFLIKGGKSSTVVPIHPSSTTFK